MIVSQNFVAQSDIPHQQIVFPYIKQELSLDLVI